MDYSFYGASQQPYHYLGMPANAYANTGIDPEAMRSVVSVQSQVCGALLQQRPRTPPMGDLH